MEVSNNGREYTSDGVRLQLVSVRVLEVHNGLTALIAEHATGADGSKFDG